jgi:parvulin-like peptidyl-prolyl isomerase
VLAPLLALALAFAACGKGAPAPGPGDRAAPAPAAASGEPGRDAGEGARVAASIITVAHAGVSEYSSRRPKPSRSEAEALELARAIAAEARRDPARFQDIARERSEDPLAPNGGDLGTWRAGEHPDVDAAVAALAIGEVSDPIASEYGYRILRRDPPLPEARVAARHLVVAWAGATRAPAALARSKPEALARAEELAARARRDPGAFEALIRAESDGWDRERGGRLGAWTTNSGRFPGALDRAVLALSEGAISGPVESEFGYQLLQRLPAEDAPALLAGAHILIAFEGAEKARPGVKRSKDEARAEAERILEEARRDPSRFGQLAAARSDDATGARGGDLGSFRRGSMPAPLEEALAGLGMGEVGGPVLTPYGYHVLIRREAPTDKDYVGR